MDGWKDRMGGWKDELTDGCMSGWWVGPCVLNKIVLCRGWVRVGGWKDGLVGGFGWMDGWWVGPRVWVSGWVLEGWMGEWVWVGVWVGGLIWLVGGRRKEWRMDRLMGGLVDEWVDGTTGLKVGQWKDGWMVGVTQGGLGVWVVRVRWFVGGWVG